jgi:hypothetical protein
MAADKEGYQVAAVHKLIEELGRQGALKAAESDGDRRAIEAAISYMSDEEAGVGFLYSGWCQAALPHKKLADEAVWKVQTERVTLVALWLTCPPHLALPPIGGIADQISRH